jgi:hypothetical protein
MATSSCPFETQWRRLNVESFPPETRPMTLCFTPGSGGVAAVMLRLFAHVVPRRQSGGVMGLLASQASRE